MPPHRPPRTGAKTQKARAATAGFAAIGILSTYSRDRLCGVAGWTLHDLRRTFAFGLASQGIGLPVIECLLNHVSGTFGGIVGVYQRYDFMPEMKDAIAKWEDCIARMLA